ILGSCSAIVDFTPIATRDAGPGLDAGDSGEPTTEDDAGARDAHAEAGRSDTGPQGACQLGSHQGCGGDQLCCDRGDGNGPHCIDVSGSTECAACGVACNDPAAPHCGANRTCECEPGSGQGCANNQRCMGTGTDARCVECQTDDDCSTRAGRTQCVNAKCAQCDRGANPDDSSDDQGCNDPTRPICDANNTCTACTVNPDNCPSGQTCNGALGCFGCSLFAPVGMNECGGTTPICKPTATEPQCSACTANSECSGGFCDSRPAPLGTGACTNVCAPASLPGMNNCSGPTPFCKQAPGNSFACAACTPADCSGNTNAPFCATDGAQQGFCVQCRPGLTDCNPNGTAPVCDATSATCRSRRASDCASGTNFDTASRTCVQCLSDGHCQAPTPHCSAKNTCGECNIDSHCTDKSAPVCNTITNTCEAGCNNDNQCADKTGTPHCDRTHGVCVACTQNSQCASAGAPLCSGATNTCVPCNMLGAAADAQCAMKTTGTVCIADGSRMGQCGQCDMTHGCTGGVCDTLGSMNQCVQCVLGLPGMMDLGCSAPKPQCIASAGGATCEACDPANNDGCPAGNTCSASFVCETNDAGPPPPTDSGI
ncbi:MAG TPA: hypothetical protein VG963_07240, partial [Polyangiaceae bacterium]|nr:hypothetical protein [Polyangiaceae bacterium]